MYFPLVVGGCHRNLTPAHSSLQVGWIRRLLPFRHDEVAVGPLQWIIGIALPGCEQRQWRGVVIAILSMPGDDAAIAITCVAEVEVPGCCCGTPGRLLGAAAQVDAGVTVVLVVRCHAVWQVSSFLVHGSFLWVVGTHFYSPQCVGVLQVLGQAICDIA